MKIRKEDIILDKQFPLHITDIELAPHYNMGGVYHWHECLEISFVKSGTGRYFIEDRVYDMSPGDIIIINNIEPHYLEVDNNAMRQPVLVFDPAFIWGWEGSSLDKQYLEPFFERGSDFRNKLDPSNPYTAEIRLNLEAILREYAQKDEAYQLMIKSRLLLILTYLIRYFRDKAKKSNPMKNKRQNLVKIENAIDFISVNYKSELKLSTVAGIVHMSPQYFSTVFKKLTGSSFVEYVNRLRVNKAAEMLKDTDRKITGIAMECGFNNTATFNESFRKFTGKTPSQFRDHINMDKSGMSGKELDNYKS